MDDLESWLGIVAAPGLDAKRFEVAHAQCPCADWLGAPVARLREIGFTESQAKALSTPNRPQQHQHLQFLQQSSTRRLIHWFDPNYPSLLRELASPPVALWAEGNLDLLQTPQLAVVGSRHPTPSGRQTAQHFAKQLTQAGLTITSGLAQGIDGEAHRGALAEKGGTIGVLGHGLAHIYPKQHQSLFAQIRQQGLLLSEYLPEQAPLAALFPQRNRIIVGLAVGTLVVEATEKSGSLISARCALEANREVFAVPGSIYSPQSAGCHQLIQQGAKLTRHVADILEELAPLLSAQLQLELPEKIYSAKGLSEQGLLANVGDEVCTLDDIAARAAMSVADVTVAMMQLELSGLVAAVPGGYIRVRGPHHV